MALTKLTEGERARLCELEGDAAILATNDWDELDLLDLLPGSEREEAIRLYNRSMDQDEEEGL